MTRSLFGSSILLCYLIAVGRRLLITGECAMGRGRAPKRLRVPSRSQSSGGEWKDARARVHASSSGGEGGAGRRKKETVAENSTAIILRKAPKKGKKMASEMAAADSDNSSGVPTL